MVKSQIFSRISNLNSFFFANGGRICTRISYTFHKHFQKPSKVLEFSSAKVQSKNSLIMYEFVEKSAGFHWFFEKILNKFDCFRAYPTYLIEIQLHCRKLENMPQDFFISLRSLEVLQETIRISFLFI